MVENSNKASVQYYWEVKFIDMFRDRSVMADGDTKAIFMDGQKMVG